MELHAMENAGWIFLAFLALQLLVSSSQNANLDLSGWEIIDCGGNDVRWEGLLPWDVDSPYTQTGSNKQVEQKTSREEFNTLRYFPNKTQNNCYIVPAETQTIRYIIRVGFYYGNYDSLSSPPTFDLFINDVKWTTVNTSKNNGEPFYEEINYQNNGSGYFKICLVQIENGGIPFISSIEAMALRQKLYSQMENNATYNLVTRTNLGGKEIRFDPLYYDEMYNRIWSKGVTPSDCTTVSGLTDTYVTTENYPPYLVLMNSIQSNGSDQITLIIDLPDQLTPQSAFFVFYITEVVDRNANETRTMNIEINGQDQGSVVAPATSETTVITKYPVMVSAGPSINVTLTRGRNSSMPPMISGMEVFTKWNTDDHPHLNDHDHSSATGDRFSSAAAFLLMIIFVFLIVA